MLRCRASRLVRAAAAAGRAAAAQAACRTAAPAAGLSEFAAAQAAACICLNRQAASFHSGRQLSRAEPAEELHEEHRAALRRVIPKVPLSTSVESILLPRQHGGHQLAGPALKHC